MASTRPRIAVDAMGGDHAPNEIVAGAIRASEELDVEIILVGDYQQVQAALNLHPSSKSLRIVNAEGVIEMGEEPLKSLRRKPQASINVAMDLVKNGEADAVVSAGHSGAAMAAAKLRLDTLTGIKRPAIGALFPTMLPGKSVIILDVGANVDSDPEYLEQFALMGSVYSKYVLDIEQPQVGLLNMGEEPGKGDKLTKETYKLLVANPYINFRGNAEGRDVLSGDFDVIVCDGFVGNVLLKFTEAVGSTMLQIMRQELPRGWRGQMGTAFLKPNLQRIKQRIDHAEHGGALLFGVSGVCVISHGSSQAPSIFNAIRLGKEAVTNKVIERIQHPEQIYQNSDNQTVKTSTSD
jgi:glycerol-3-phosphate acyltransferase PlsX